MALTFEEATQFYSRKEAEEAAGRAWVARHPEVQQLMHDFVAAVLRDKPADVRAYAVGYFLRYRVGGGGGEEDEGEVGEGEGKAGEGSDSKE